MWKCTLSGELWVNHFAFPQNFHTRKLSEATIFDAVNFSLNWLPLQIKPIELLYKCSRTSYLKSLWERENEHTLKNCEKILYTLDNSCWFTLNTFKRDTETLNKSSMLPIDKNEFFLSKITKGLILFKRFVRTVIKPYSTNIFESLSNHGIG